MFKMYFLLFLLAHILGDYYLQNGIMAEHKNKRVGWLLFHGALYALPFWLIPIFVQRTPALLWSLLAMTLLHLAIDAAKSLPKICKIKKGAGKTEPKQPAKRPGFGQWLESHRAFTGKKIVPILLDQALHLLVLVLAAYFLVGRVETILLSRGFASILETIGLSPQSLLVWTLALAAAWKPANLLIFFILQDYESEGKEVSASQKENDLKAGRMIGLLERVIILILVSLGQSAGISLVIAAKTLARFNRIKEDKEFAERYLIGTLLSTLFAIILSLMLS